MLSDDLTRWFDDELWNSVDSTGAMRYASPVAPQELLSDAPSVIWPALMPCDFLPVVGNQMGDWLCVRIDDDNRAGEMIQWYHGGGDWIPWGDSLPQAILFDSMRGLLPGGDRDHAVAAASTDQPRDEFTEDEDAITRWAKTRLPDAEVDSLEGLRGHDLAERLLALGIASHAVRCQLIIDALSNPLLDSAAVSQWRKQAPDAVQRALFDNRLIPDDRLSHLTPHGATGEQLLSQQNWLAVETLAQSVSREAPHLAWGWDLLGYALERRGETAGAIEAYRKGLDCSIFTDQTVRVRTHGFSSDGQKFSASRLNRLDFRPTDPVEREYYSLLIESDEDQRRDRVREYFAERARRERGAAAHDLWKRAGWDLGAEPMAAFAELLEHVAATAEATGRHAQAALARTHRQCFRDRYRL